MKFLNSRILKYGLHDTLINRIQIRNNGIALYFNSGVYLLNKLLQETELSGCCVMDIKIDSFDVDNLHEHIMVKRIKYNTITEIDCRNLVSDLEQSHEGFMIDVDYYSDFAKSLILKGFYNQSEYEITITEIKSIKYLFIK